MWDVVLTSGTSNFVFEHGDRRDSAGMRELTLLVQLKSAILCSKMHLGFRVRV